MIIFEKISFKNYIKLNLKKKYIAMKKQLIFTKLDKIFYLKE